MPELLERHLAWRYQWHTDAAAGKNKIISDTAEKY